MGRMTRYYVRHFGDDNPSRRDGHEFEIQIVDDVGQAVAWVELTGEDRTARIDGVPVPAAVIDAARCLPMGTGDFVDDDGNQVLPVDL